MSKPSKDKSYDTDAGMILANMAAKATDDVPLVGGRPSSSRMKKRPAKMDDWKLVDDAAVVLGTKFPMEGAPRPPSKKKKDG